MRSREWSALMAVALIGVAAPALAADRALGTADTVARSVGGSIGPHRHGVGTDAELEHALFDSLARPQLDTDINGNFIPDTLERPPFNKCSVEQRRGIAPSRAQHPDLCGFAVAPRIASAGTSLMIYICKQTGEVADTVVVSGPRGRVITPALTLHRVGAYQWGPWHVGQGLPDWITVDVRTPHAIYRARVQITK